MPIIIDNISKSFGECKIVDKFSLTLPENNVVCLWGKSGSGKTTIMNMVAGIIKPDKGKIIGIEDKKISYVFQENRLIPWLSAKENVKLAIDSKYKDEEALFWLEKLMLGEVADKKPCSLSGGMQRRVSIARALAHKADVLLLDEPFTGLDMQTKNVVMNIIKDMTKSTIILLITHNYYEAKFLSKTICTIGE